MVEGTLDVVSYPVEVVRRKCGGLEDGLLHPNRILAQELHDPVPGPVLDDVEGNDREHGPLSDEERCIGRLVAQQAPRERANLLLDDLPVSQPLTAGDVEDLLAHPSLEELDEPAHRGSLEPHRLAVAGGLKIIGTEGALVEA